MSASSRSLLSSLASSRRSSRSPSPAGPSAGSAASSPRVESLGAFERGALPRDDGLERDGVSLLLPARFRRLAGAEPALELRELALARGDRLRALAQGLLQLLDLGVALPV